MTYLSQNFLVDRKYLKDILEATAIKKTDTLLEIGPGEGILTEELCKKAKQVIAIETDQRLVGFLKSLQVKYPNLAVKHGDFNKFNWRILFKDEKFKIAANIPYHVTGLILRTIFDYKQSLPERVVLMMQYEVAKKILAKDDNQNILSNLIRCFGQATLVCKVDKKAFRPIPQVDSAVLLVKNIKRPEIEDFDDFFTLIKKGFSSRRKTLLNNLSSGLNMAKSDLNEKLMSVNIDPNRRAQTISYDEWKKLYYLLEAKKNN